jgi:hypothetical protein
MSELLVECRVTVLRETVDEVHRLGGSLQYAIEDGLRVWLFAAQSEESARLRRSIAAKRGAMTRAQRDVVKANPMRDPSKRWLTIERKPHGPSPP